jgi:S-adenosylmethionine:tRNA ribosyltransferase-isomerase
MKTSDFYFELPPRLIAQYPPERRGQSRLMVLDRVTGKRQHRAAAELPAILSGPPFDDRGPPLLVFNNSKVRKARLLGRSARTGGQAEFLLLAPAEPRAPGGGSRVWKVMAQRAKRRRPGSRYVFYDTAGGGATGDGATGDGGEIARAEITGAEGEFRALEFDRPIDDIWLDRYGHIPLPPYIRRADAPADAERYQTVYASAAGSVAAPTAGLHFTPELLEKLAAAGIESVFITLHVGLGTFLPVRGEHIEDHLMHEEAFSIDEAAAAAIGRAKTAGRPVVAVGTTSVRALESAWEDTAPRPGAGTTSIFIYPGYRFRAADALFTNFHTPESTLLMLVSAFAGRELILESYAEAIREGYRFFSYGDAMLIV